MVKNIFATAGVAFLLSATAANATGTGITTQPMQLFAQGQVTAIYVFGAAQDTDVLSEIGHPAFGNIFCNNAHLSCTLGFAGQTDPLFPPNQSGPIAFNLLNTTTHDNFATNALATDNFYHALISTDFSVYGVDGGVVPSAVTAAIALLPPGQSVTFVGFEDQIIGSDYDYNDLIFAFAGIALTQTTVPEPITISLFGFGVAGAGMMTYRRRRAKKA